MHKSLSAILLHLPSVHTRGTQFTSTYHQDPEEPQDIISRWAFALSTTEEEDTITLLSYPIWS